MRPCVKPPLSVRGLEYGGAKPLFCIPLVAADLDQLLDQAKIARGLTADLVEWRADFYRELTAAGPANPLRRLRSVLADEPIIFTLRIKAEGGAQDVPQVVRQACIEEAAASGLVDIIDVELCNEPAFLESTALVAREHGVHVILSFHDFARTPANGELVEKIDTMRRQGADIAKIAVMPQTPGDVLRLLEATLEARRRFPRLPLCTTSMGRLGSLSRLPGFLFGSDMAFASGQESSAPGQIPIAEARAIATRLIRNTYTESCTALPAGWATGAEGGARGKVARGIYLIGFSGSGKSTIARLIGDRLQCPAYDLDQVIAERAGMTIPAIFDRDGEPGFRLREAEALRAVSDAGQFVVATGGGAPVRPENRLLMAERGWIICLEGRPEILRARIQQQLEGSGPDAVRPMLDAVDPLEKVRALKQSRQSVYALADWTVHTDYLTPQQVVDEVIRAVDVLEKAAVNRRV